MGKIEDLAVLYGEHIEISWQRSIASAQKVITVIYPKDIERTLRARVGEFEQRTRSAGHEWVEFDCTQIFAKWMANDDYREAYFECPDDLPMKLEGEFPGHVAEALRKVLLKAGENSVVAMTGISSLYGFLRISELLPDIERDIQGRLVVFFPGSKDSNNYRLLDARDGWNYLATSISLHGTGTEA